MFAPRNIQLSVHKKISDLFTAPPNNPDTSAAYIATAYNVYSEDDYQNDSFTTTFPFVFLLMARVPPKKTRLPCIIMEFSDFPNVPYEMGTRRGMAPTITLHIFGRNRGERDEMAGLIRLVLTDYPALAIYDWTVKANPTLKYTAVVEDIGIQTQTIAPDLGAEGSLANWNALTFTLPWLKD